MDWYICDLTPIVAIRKSDGAVYVSLPDSEGSLLWEEGDKPLVQAKEEWQVIAMLEAAAIAMDRATCQAWISCLERHVPVDTQLARRAELFINWARPKVEFTPAKARPYSGDFAPLDVNSVYALYERLAELDQAPEESAGADSEGEVLPGDIADFVAQQVQIAVTDLADGYNVLFVGPTGSGKNTAAEAVFKRLGWHVEAIEGKENLDDLYVCGAIVPQEGGLRWVDGPLARALRRAAQEPVLLWFNEINRCQRKHLNILISVLDPKPAMLFESLAGVAESPSGRYLSLEIPQTGELLVAPVEHFHVLAACNLGSQYAVAEFDPALERRFGTVVEFDYLEPEQESRLLRASVPALPERLARAMASLAHQVRAQWRNAECAAPLDTGRVIVWARKVAREPEATPGTVLATARTTWLPVVAGRDHSGLVDRGIAQGLEELVQDLVGGVL